MTSAQAQFLPSAPAENPAPAWAEDSLGRRTPRGTVVGFLNAVADENYDRASRYLHLTTIPKKTRTREGLRLAQTLQRLLDQGGNIIAYSRISNNQAGNPDDNLGQDLDRVGSVSVNGESFDVLVERTIGPDGGPIWLFSSQTLRRMPAVAGEVAPLTDRLLPAYLKETRWGGVPIGHWLAMILLAVLCYALAWAITSVALLITRLVWRRSREEPLAGVMKAFALPIMLYLAVWLLGASSREAGVSILVRQWFTEMNVIVAMIALVLLLWRLVHYTTKFSERQLSRRGNQAGVSAVLFLRRSAKIALIFFATIAILSTFGFDVTTGLAALGIGGIALALGAQKTVENFVGSVTLIADQPIRVGDFCKVGDTVGTVEQIGMRSTRIRTNHRTVVTIPNGEFSSLKIENFAHRDRFWFNPTLGLRYETTPDQIRYLLVELRAILYAHPKVLPDPARVRFAELGADSLKIEIFAYVQAKDFNEFLEVKEDLILRIMDVVEASGTGFAFPSQTLYLARDKGVSEEKAQDAAEKVRQWREKEELHIPSFDFDEITKISSSIPYPPLGSSKRKNMGNE
jgi:MscS family membrane protein